MKDADLHPYLGQAFHSPKYPMAKSAPKRILHWIFVLLFLVRVEVWPRNEQICLGKGYFGLKSAAKIMIISEIGGENV